MKRFKHFLLENYFLSESAKKEQFVNRHMKIFADHPNVKSNPQAAREIISHTHEMGLDHHGSIFANRAFLSGELKPNEDEISIRKTVQEWNKAKKEGLVTGEISEHNYASARSQLYKFKKPASNIVYPEVGETLKKYHIGQIEHPEHGTLQVYHISDEDIRGNTKEYGKLSRDLKRQLCSDSTHCVVDEENGPSHLKSYSQGHGFFTYLNKNNETIFSHGFRDRGIVDPMNDVVSPEEHKFLTSKTSKLLPERHRESYDFFTNKKHDLETQSKMYDRLPCGSREVAPDTRLSHRIPLPA